MWKVWYFSFNPKLLFLSYFGNKLSVNSCEIMFTCCCVSKVCYFQSWVYPTPTSLMKGMISSFSFKLLFLSYFGGKLFVSFCEFWWDHVWVQIFCAMQIVLAKLKLKTTCLCVLHSYKFCDMYELWIPSSFYKIVSFFHAALSSCGY